MNTTILYQNHAIDMYGWADLHTFTGNLIHMITQRLRQKSLEDRDIVQGYIGYVDMNNTMGEYEAHIEKNEYCVHVNVYIDEKDCIFVSIQYAE